MRPYRVYVHGQGNSFMVELARLLVSGLSEFGRDAAIELERLPDRSSQTIDLIVDPEAYVSIAGPAIEADLLSAVERSVVIGTEQPGTVWFERQLPYMGAARLALDLDTHAVEQLGRVGIHSKRLPLGYHHSWDHWGGDTKRLRPRDVAFLGAVNDRRERFLAEAASRLWDRYFELRLFEVSRPKHAEDPGFLAGGDKWSWLAGTKLLLNVHRGSAPYFEWLRALEAMVNGCVLVSEPSDDPAPLVAGEHFVQAPLHLLPEYAIGLLADPHRLQAMADTTYQFLRAERRMADLLRPAVEEIESLPSVTPRRGARIVALPPEPIAPPEAAIDQVLETQRRVDRWLRHLLVSDEEHRRRLDALECRLADGDERDQTIETTPGWERCDADVSVVISFFECRHGLEDAVESALGSLGVDVEVIVVDCPSRDGSSDTVRRRMEEDRRAPLALITKSAYCGRAAVRGLGVRASRAPFVLFLDSKETLYPNGLAKLRAVLAESPVAFAYGIVQRVGVEPGLSNFLPWDVDRLCAGEYLSGAALVRRQALERLRGVEEPPVTVSGPEEYDLWLRCAAEGHHGMLLPEVVVRRQSSPPHRLSRAEIRERGEPDTFLPDRLLRPLWPDAVSEGPTGEGTS